MTEEMKEAVPEYSKEEVKAMEKGWLPKDQYEGDPDDWVTAREFNLKGEFIGKFRSQDKQIHNLKAQLDHLVGMYNTAEDRGRKQAIDELKQAKKAAIKDGDLERASEIEDKIDEVKDMKVQTITTSTPNPVEEYFNSTFLPNNQWFIEDPARRAYAVGYMKTNEQRLEAMSPEKAFAEVEKSVREEFPHKYRNAARDEQTVAGSNTTTRPKGGKKYSTRDLDEATREIGKRLVERGAFKDMDGYIEQLVKDGTLK